ncbi:Flp family type IVb pilin [Fictibacillus sp. NPDC058756]|uniref:Flp family type IVb pilin n=1 Tax=Fictibacillus TaxID=1329200 RepID=UPI0010297593|nr:MULTISPECIES: Flp family type IVb pilin [Fictibacillus]RZT21090.1 pilus assembly protein Flp/PilA [Fictibacillus sp. BK138]
MKNKLMGLIKEEQGQGMTEYGLVLGLIAVAAVGALAMLRTEIVEMFTTAKDMVVNRESGGTTTP